jgi:hypothetical protein
MSIRIRHRTAHLATIVVATLGVASALAFAVPQANAASPKTTHKGHALARGVSLRGVHVRTPRSSREAMTIIWVTRIGTGSATCHYSDGSTAGEGEQATLMVSFTGSDGETHWITAVFECGSDGKWHPK